MVSVRFNRLGRSVVIVATTMLLFAGPCPLGAREADQSQSQKSQRSLEKVLQTAIQQHRGRVGVAVKHLVTGESYTYRAEEPMPTASLIKFPIMAAAYQAIEEGKLSPDDVVELTEDGKVPGSGILTYHFSPGAKISLRDAIHLMMVYSDNTATNLVIDQIGLPATTEYMEKLGRNATKLHSKVYRGDTSIAPERSKQFGLGSTSAGDMLHLLEMLHKGELVSQEASEKMLEHMYACDDKLKSTRHLPPGTRVAHKTGSVSATRTDAGIIDSPNGPIAFCILTTDNEDRSWTDENEGDLLCSEIALSAYRYFNTPDAPPVSVARTLRIGADGPLVEALQRTINARLDPSPELMVDGDFGPDTQSGVKKFQLQEKLEPTGVVDADTWRALGALIFEDRPVPEPSIVNSATIEKEPADSLDGPPFVTSKAWAIVDAESGEMLAGMDESKLRDPASTTKIMTAYLITSLAEQQPEVLDEIVTFSERADKTPGSTSGVKEGEQLSVGELLYGLMLPSGNDASVALAEHFGPRFSAIATGGDSDEPDAQQEDNDDAALDPHDQFVRAMNRKAAELGMASTTYKNPHGLTAKGHQTTASDLAKLAIVALQQPEFAKRVSTARHGTTVDSISGYRRNIVWKNTNRLLQHEGYDGVKTGTTGPAGCCLVSRGEHGGRKLIVVVLGATSSDARYADTRNLYRWAWKELLQLTGDESQSRDEKAGS